MQHTFEIRSAPEHPEHFGPDELVIFWGNVPRTARARLLLPEVYASSFVAHAARRHGPRQFRALDDHTLECLVG